MLLVKDSYIELSLMETQSSNISLKPLNAQSLAPSDLEP